MISTKSSTKVRDRTVKPTEDDLRAALLGEQERHGKELRAEQERRKRVVAALLALRAVKAVNSNVEPVIRSVRTELLNLPAKLAPVLELEDSDVIGRILLVEMWRIVEDIDMRLEAIEDAPRTPVYARYVMADRELKPGDLEIT